MMPLAELRYQLESQWRLLQAREQGLAETWRDSGYQRFRQRHWEKWEQRVPPLLLALERLDAIAEQALAVTDEP